MDGEQPRLEAPGAVHRDDLDQRIAWQDAVIQTIEGRLAAASGPRARFSVTALHTELALEQELAAARDVRGGLIYDRRFAKAASA